MDDRDRLAEAVDLLAEMGLALQVASQANRQGGWGEGSPFQARVDELLARWVDFAGGNLPEVGR